ncbi:hypothetical protein VQ042_01365 [Aurantimonas sp. A2-1-M11]|uniref:hypothetical protein n=1 Tax=Aurantimonas sp. A2-1-M11 TaxID=3113712 RepID=UPI002F9325EE
MVTSTGNETPWYKLKRVWAALVAAVLIGGMAVGGLTVADVGSLTELADYVTGAE